MYLILDILWLETVVMTWLADKHTLTFFGTDSARQTKSVGCCWSPLYCGETMFCPRLRNDFCSKSERTLQIGFSFLSCYPKSKLLSHGYTPCTYNHPSANIISKIFSIVSGATTPIRHPEHSASLVLCVHNEI